MQFDYQCTFDLNDCIKRLGLEEHGRVQRAVDETFLTGVEPFVPKDEGWLIDSGRLHTDIGSGEIVWDADKKARRLYYGEEDWNWSNGGMQTEDEKGNRGLRGPYWAERYIQNGGKEEIEKAAREAVRR